jgi:hypothetical protein
MSTSATGGTILVRALGAAGTYKVAGWYNKADLVADLERIRLVHQGKVGVKVVNNLGEDAGEVDRVDSAELQVLVSFSVAKQDLDNVLAVVKGSINGEVVDISVGARRHLGLLDGADAAFGVEDGDCDILLSLQAVDSSRAGLKCQYMNLRDVIGSHTSPLVAPTTVR